MMKSALTPISVMMRIDDASEMIADTVESILSQSHTAFEFLILDGSSRADGADLIRRYGDSRIRLVTPASAGPAAAYNEALALASHELIARTDPGCISHPWRLEKQVSFLEAQPDCALVGTWIKEMDVRKRYLRTSGCPDTHLYYALYFSPSIHPASVMYRKQAALAAGGYREGGCSQDLSWRLCLRHSIHMIEEPLQGCCLSPEERLCRERLTFLFPGASSIPEAFLYCYRYNRWPPDARPTVAALYDCLAQLEMLSGKILSMENPNRDAEHIRAASRQQADYIFRNVAGQLPVSELRKLLFRPRRTARSLLSALRAWRYQRKAPRPLPAPESPAVQKN